MNNNPLERLKQISAGLDFQTTRIGDLLPSVSGEDGKAGLLRVAADVRTYSEDLKKAIEALKDWNSRHNIPIP